MVGCVDLQSSYILQNEEFNRIGRFYRNCKDCSEAEVLDCHIMQRGYVSNYLGYLASNEHAINFEDGFPSLLVAGINYLS